jgi:hypothetical protein
VAPIVVGVATIAAIGWAGYQLYNGGARAIIESLSHAGSGTMTKGDARVFGKIVGAIVTLKLMPGALAAGFESGSAKGIATRTTIQKVGLPEPQSIAATVGELEAPKIEYTIDEKSAGHIFRAKENHVLDTPANRALMIDVASNPENVAGLDKYGSEWAQQIRSDGSQVWTQSRGGVIRNAGINEVPRPFNADTGFSSLTRGW